MVTAEVVVQNLWKLPDTPQFTHVLSIHTGRLADQQKLLPPPGSTIQCKEILLADSPNVDIVEWFPGQSIIYAICFYTQLTLKQKYASLSTKLSRHLRAASSSTATLADPVQLPLSQPTSCGHYTSIVTML